MKFRSLVRRELKRARKANPPMTSAHHAYGVILEELDEFWDEVRRKPRNRKPEDMLSELVQVGAMAQRAAEDLGLL